MFDKNIILLIRRLTVRFKHNRHLTQYKHDYHLSSNTIIYQLRFMFNYRDLNTIRISVKVYEKVYYLIYNQRKGPLKGIYLPNNYG